MSVTDVHGRARELDVFDVSDRLLLECLRRVVLPMITNKGLSCALQLALPFLLAARKYLAAWGMILISDGA